MYYNFQVYYSKEYKLYDLVIKKDNVFISNYHIPNKKEINRIINKELNKLK